MMSPGLASVRHATLLKFNTAPDKRSRTGEKCLLALSRKNALRTKATAGVVWIHSSVLYLSRVISMTLYLSFPSRKLQSCMPLIGACPLHNPAQSSVLSDWCVCEPPVHYSLTQSAQAYGAGAVTPCSHQLQPARA
jgi:hypothetical protein